MKPEAVMPAEAGIHRNLQRWIPAFAGMTYLLLHCALAHGSEAQLKEGNRLFWNGRYEDALKKYNEATVDAPNSPVLRFNTGAAAYQSRDFGSAEQKFKETAGMVPDPMFQAAAHYNRGNALFRQGQWAQAIEAYQASLRANPRDEDAKYNLGLAMTVQKNPSQSPQQPKPDKSQKKNGEQGPPKQPPDKKPGDMTKEEAERLLSAAGSDEKKKSNARSAKPGSARPEEDW